MIGEQTGIFGTPTSASRIHATLRTNYFNNNEIEKKDSFKDIYIKDIYTKVLFYIALKVHI